MRMVLWVGAMVATVNAGRHSGRCRPRGALAARLEEMVRQHPHCRVAMWSPSKSVWSTVIGSAHSGA